MADTTKIWKWTALSAACVLIVLASILACEYVTQKQNLAAAQAFSKAQDATIAEKDKLIVGAVQQMAKRDAEFADREREFEQERTRIKDTKTAQKAIADAIPGAAVLSVKKDELPPQAISALPDAPSYALMPEQTAIDLARMTVDFKAANARVAKLTLDVTDLKTQLSATEDKYTAAQADAKQWKTAAQGGSAAHRTLTTAKWVAGTAAVTAVICRFIKK